MEISRNACPRNCYGTCSIISYVDNGKLIKVTGDPKHGFTKGHLCAKGYAYTQYVYNPLRLKYPMLQSPRGSGQWERISWDDAYTIIAEKILDLHRRYGSNLATGYNKFSGNLGLLHYAIEGMFNSIGPHTKPYGNLCLSTGEQAVRESFGDLKSPIPEDMEKSKLIVIWGANPAVTNIHQMKFIYKARKAGAKLVVIDPLYTETAAKADIYVQIKPGTDTLLALGIGKIICNHLNSPSEFENHNEFGWSEYKNLLRGIELSDVCRITGVELQVIEELATLYETIKPIATWNGFGLQRNKFGGQSIKAINSLVALTRNLDVPNGGVYYTHSDTTDFPLNLLNFPEKKHPTVPSSRLIDSTNYAEEAQSLTEPPLKLLWIAARSPLSQDQNIKVWMELFDQLELIITADLFMTETAKLSDLVLPVASHFEEEDLNVGYWHHWLSINQKSIEPYYEAKSDLKIARELTKKLNELSPGFSTFPSELEPMDWINAELSEDVKSLYGISSYHDLIDGPKHRKYKDIPKQGNTFSFVQINDVEQMLEEVVLNKDQTYPFRLLSPQSLLKIHSQFSTLPWLHPAPDESVVEINEKVATNKGIVDGSKVNIFNENGFVTAKAKTNPHLPSDVILVKQTGENSINQLICTDVRNDGNASSTHFYDSFADISPA